MALIGNRSILHNSPGRFLSGTAGTLRSGFNKPGMAANRFEQMDDLSGAIPAGHLSPSAWALPRTGGGMSSRNACVITFTASGEGAAGLGGVGSSTITFTASGTGGLIAGAVGNATITFSAAASISGTVSAVGSSAIVFTASAAIGALGYMVGQSSTVFSGTLTPYGIGHMVGSTVDLTELTASSVATAVWAAVATANNDAGTMGEKLNDAGSAGNPWATVIESGYTAEEILRLLAAYAAGNASGLDGSATFKGIDGTTNRIVGSVSGGTRTITALDGS